MTEFAISSERLATEETYSKADFLITQHREVIDFLWKEFSLDTRPEDIPMLYLTEDIMSTFCPDKSQPWRIKIGLNLAEWKLTMPHETAHYLQYLRNPGLNNKPIYEQIGFDQKPTDIYHLGELVAEYASQLYLYNKEELEAYKAAVGTDKSSSYPPVNKLFDSDKTLLGKLASMDEKEANRDFKGTLEEMRKLHTSLLRVL